MVTSSLQRLSNPVAQGTSCESGVRTCAPDVTVRVLEVKGNQVRLGVDAPAAVRIYREEVYRAVQKENEEAAVHDAVPLDEASKAWQKQRDKH